MSLTPDAHLQQGAPGTSVPALLDAVLAAAEPRDELSWLDVGCGTGDLLRLVADRWQPASLHGADIIEWLSADLRDRVEFHHGPAEAVLPAITETFDRVVLCESLEHMEAPWLMLRAAARLVAPGGRLVVSVPNVASIPQRLDLLFKGHLTSYPPQNEAHLTPVLPHVVVRILRSEGFAATFDFAGTMPVPLLGHDRWPAMLRRHPRLTSMSVVVGAQDIRQRLS
jgi:SAM-dependent methyltransferase